jgi:hypothetical protein
MQIMPAAAIESGRHIRGEENMKKLLLLAIMLFLPLARA